jgi:hypothetical protein
MIKPDIEALGVQERIYSASPVRPTGSRRGQAVGWEASRDQRLAISMGLERSLLSITIVAFGLQARRYTRCPSTYRRFASAAGSIEEPITPATARTWRVREMLLEGGVVVGILEIALGRIRPRSDRTDGVRAFIRQCRLPGAAINTVNSDPDDPVGRQPDNLAGKVRENLLSPGHSPKSRKVRVVSNLVN